MNKGMKRFIKKITSMILTGTILAGGFSELSVKAATSQQKEAFRQIVIEMLETGDGSVRNIREYDLTYSEYNKICKSVYENECKIAYKCYIKMLGSKGRIFL